MPKPKSANFDVKVDENPEAEVVEIVPPEPRFLTEDALHLRDTWGKEESPRDAVPPQTPNSEFAFEDSFRSLPSPFPDLDNLEVPYVREKGVRFCIEALGEYFNCKDYKFNLLQFWFLDIITDCLWRAQDDFKLPVELQKTVLAWVLYFVDILRDTQRNMSRKKFFAIFRDAILVAAEIVDEGCDAIPTPEKVFAIIEEDDSESSSSDSASTTSSIGITSDDYDNISVIELEVDGTERVYELPKEVCTCDNYDLASVDTPTETDTMTKQSNEEVEDFRAEELNGMEEEEEEEEVLEDVEFYQPDPNIPQRFLPLPEDVEEAVEEQSEAAEVPDKSICKIEEAEGAGSQIKVQDQCGVHEVATFPDKFQITFDSASTTTKDSKATESSESEDIGLHKVRISGNASDLEKKERKSLVERRVLKTLTVQKVWEQRLLDMDNPRRGWIPTDREIEDQEEEVAGEADESDGDGADDDDEWVDMILKKRKTEIKEGEDKQVVNFGVLWAIVDFIFKYFYESFQFSLIKLAFQATPDIITQKVNEEWKIPKKIKEQLQKPKEEKPKKPKKEKAPKGKKDKKSDKGKKDKKGKDKKSDKKSAKASSKKDKKSKKEKPAKLTKEQKAELERQRKEQERLEEELRKLEENKRFMFPLTDAATDDLFKNIFENWVKVDLTKKGGKGKGKDKGKKKK